jgi:hypothetical protein
VARELDLGKLPVYPGAQLTQQVSLTGDQIASLTSAAPEAARANLAKLTGIQVLSYRLAKNAVPKNVLAFYEPRILGAGYKVMMKNFEEGEDSTYIFTGPNNALLIVSVSTDDDDPELEMVSVRGSLAGLSGLSGLGALGALGQMPASGKTAPVAPAAPVAPSAPKPPEAPAPPRSEQEEPEALPVQ